MSLIRGEELRQIYMQDMILRILNLRSKTAESTLRMSLNVDWNAYAVMTLYESILLFPPSYTPI